MSVNKESLRRHAVKVVQRQRQLDLLRADLDHANEVPGPRPNIDANSGVLEAPDQGFVAAVDLHDKQHAQDEVNLGDAGAVNDLFLHVVEPPVNPQDNADENVQIESSSSDASEEEEITDEEGDGRPVFANDNEKEQYVIDTVREWAQEPGVLSMTKLDHLLHRLGIVFPRMPLTYTTLFACEYDFDIRDIEGGQLWYKGIQTNLNRLDLREYLQKFNKITIDVGIDGLPLKFFKIWPILGYLVGTDNPPFIIAIYKGTKDPDNVHDFLADFVAELQELFLNNYILEGSRYEFVVRNYILDALARQFVKCIIPHNGYAGCEKCEVYGEYIDNRVVFLDLDAPLRTDQSFRDRRQLRHHRGHSSPLEDLGTGMVSQFRLDPMHLVWGGVVKRLLDYWLNVVGEWKLPFDLVEIISSVFEFLKPYCPSDFNRKPKSLKYFKSFKCTEFRRIILYDGILAFKDLVEDNVYKNFLLLHCATYIMCSETLYAANHDLAVQLVRTFISHSSQVYGRSFVVYNVHSFSHLIQECDLGYTLDDITAFKFENALKSIKESLRSGLHAL